MPINTLSDLFNIDINALSLSNKTTTFDPATNTTVIAGTTTVLGFANQMVSASFINGQLIGVVKVTLISISWEQLERLNLVPKTDDANTHLSAVTFASITVTPQPETRGLIFNGNGLTGNLPIDGIPIPINNTTFYLKVRLADDNQTVISELAYLGGNLQIGQGLAMQFYYSPNDYTEWRLQSVNTDPSALTNGLSDLTPLTGTDILPLLPVNILGLSHFAVAGLAVHYNSMIGVLGVDITISSTDIWPLIGDVLHVSSLSFSLSFVRWCYTGGRNWWQISGTITGTVELFNIPCQLSISLPPSASDWTLSIYPNVKIPGLGDLASSLSSLIGVGDLSTSLPPGLDTLGELTVEFLEIVFNPSKASAAEILKSITIRLTNENGWALPYAPEIQLTNIFIDLNIVAPLGDSAERIVTGTLGGTVYFYQIYIPLLFQRPTAESNWTMTIAYTDIEITLPDLISLAGLDGNVLKRALPSNLSIVSDLALTSLTVDYDLTANALDDVKLAFELNDTWKIIDDYLEVTDLGLFAEYYPLADSADWEYFIFIRATLEIAKVGFFVSAGNVGDAGDWTLTGKMGEGQSIALNDLINWLMERLLVTDFKLPPELPVITVTDMSISLTPATSAFKGLLSSKITWTVPFCSTIFQIPNLTVSIDIGDIPHYPHTGPRPYTFTASGKFQLTTFAAFEAIATFSTGGGTSPTILTIEAAASDVHLPELVNAILSPNADGHNAIKAWDAAYSPDGLLKPSVLVQAGLQLNLTNNTFLVYGMLSLPADDPRHDLYGMVALLVLPRPQNDRSDSYALAVTLNNFRFGKLLSSLSFIDDILPIREAALLFSSEDGTQDLTALTSYMPKFVDVIKDDMGYRYEAGVDFYAVLQFDGGLLVQVAALLGITIQGPFILRGFIASSQIASFEAELGTYTLLNTLSFKNVSLSYTTFQANTIGLWGVIFIDLGHTPYGFEGSLNITRVTTNQITTTEASAHIAGDYRITNPLGIPKLEIAATYLDFYYAFDGIQSDTQYMLSGVVRFSDVISMTGLIYFKNAAPSVVVIQLENLDIGAFFQKLTDLTWDWFVFRLKNGMLYYAPNAVSLTVYDRAQKNTSLVPFSQGFHASSDIDIFFIKDFHIDVTINDNGIIATGGYITPIDWGFVQFYRGPSTSDGPSDLTKGPIVSIDTVKSIFTLSGGFGLFGTPIASLLMSVKPAGITGTIAFDQTLSIFGKPSFDFTWDDGNGFEVTNWKLGALKLPNLVFVAKDFEDSLPEGKCAMSGIVELPIKSELNLTPSFSVKLLETPGQTAASPHLVITLNGSFDLVVNSSAFPDVLLSAPIGNATLVIPFPGTDNFTWDTLALSFVDCLKGAAYSIFETLIANPQNLAKLLAVEGLVWAAEEVKNFLICKAVKQGIEQALAETEAQAFIDGAVSATVVTVSVLGVSGIVIGGVVGSIDSSGYHHNSGSNDNNNQTPRPDTPTAPTLSYENDQLKISWQPVPHANLYCAIVTEDDKPYLQTNATSDLFMHIAARRGHHYTAQIVAAGDGGTSAPGPSGSIGMSIEAPTGVAIKYLSIRQIQVSWRAVNQATGYTVELYDSTGKQVRNASTSSVQPPAVPATNLPFDLSGLSAGSYTCIVMTTINEFSSGASAPILLTLLAALQISKLSYANGSIVAEWSALAQAVTYLVQIYQGDSSIDATALHGDGTNPPPTRLNLALTSPLTKGEVYTLYVMGITSNNSATVRNQPITILILDKVRITSAYVQNKQLNLSWPRIEGATAYAFQITEINGGSASLQIPNLQASGDLHQSEKNTIDLQSLPGGAYLAQVSAVNSDGIKAEWSDPFSFTV